MYNFEVAETHTYFVAAFEGGAAVGVHNRCGPEDLLGRYGDSWESTGRLARKAAEAEQKGFPHGVSTSPQIPPGPGRSHASVGALEEAGFPVHHTPTRNNPQHHTVELPKPVTSQVAKLFNLLFGRKR